MTTSTAGGVLIRPRYSRNYEKMADGFDAAIRECRSASNANSGLESEMRLAEACAIHFRSVANQARFVVAARMSRLASVEPILRSELDLAKRLWKLQQADSRLGFEASNQYAYIPMDLAEKVLCCRDLLDRWLPAMRAK